MTTVEPNAAPHARNPETVPPRMMANAVRALAMDAVEQAKSGHPGMPMGMADTATALFTRVLKFDPANPDWPDRDRFVLSAGHGSMLLYAILHLTGYREFDLDQLKRFRQLGSRTAGHPEYGMGPGIETTTGPLGQGLATAVGMALAERILAERYGRELVDHFTYVIAGDGCLMEGISHEAISLAGHLGLGRLIVLFDNNKISIDGPTDLAVSDDQLARFRASHWDVSEVDGHDPDAVEAAVRHAQTINRPSLISCRTVIGFGAPNKQGTAATHGAPLGAAEIAAARAALGWPHAPFVIPDDVLAAWRRAGARGAKDFAAWNERRASCEKSDRRYAEYKRVAIDRRMPTDWQEKLAAFKEKLAAEKPDWATRKSSGETLSVLCAAIPELVGGSADLTESNITRAKTQRVVGPGDFGGSYIHFGVREHAMAAALNGLALHGGFIPYGGTFLAFTDYCRPAIRLSALMKQRVVYVMTHDSIGLGEDGPTHQPVEHLAALRAIPNLLVFRPADALETAECWEAALSQERGPSVLALSRQKTPALRDNADENRSAKGAYVLAPAEGTHKIALLATGTEVAIAMAARAALHKEGIGTSVVSMPCWELFDRQTEAYRRDVLGPADGRIAVEAGLAFGWTRYVASENDVVGMRGFGESAPAEALYEHFGITVAAAIAAARKKCVRNGRGRHA